MNNPMCLIPDAKIQERVKSIQEKYPQQCQRAGFTAEMYCGWIETYNREHNQNPDYIPEDSALIRDVETKRNRDGQSFLYTPHTITYNLPGQKQRTYTVINDKIFNKDGKEVYPKDVESMKTHRLRIFANLAVQQGRAVVVEYKGNKYIVNDREQIISGKNGHIMQWGEENGDRKMIITEAKRKFAEKQQPIQQQSVVDKDQLLKDTRSKLSKVIRTGRGGSMFLYELQEPHNGYPVLYLNVYNSGDDTEFDYQYRINDAGNIEVRSKWASGDWKDDWKEKDTIHEPIKEYFNTLKQSVQAPVSSNTTTQQQPPFEYARNANGKPNYEVSSRGDKRFSAMNATFAPGTILFGHDVSGRTIESVYQHGVKQGDWTTDNNNKTGAPKDKTIITGNTENDSYTQGYLPLWQEWVRQNPQLIEELRQAAQGKVLTDMFASTAVSQARALADILNNTINQDNNRSNNNQINYGNDFRRVQETVRRGSQNSERARNLTNDERQRLADVLRRELDSQNSFSNRSKRVLKNDKHGTSFTIHEEVDPQLFHDVFEIARYYTPNGELVDLHEDYTGCKCYLNEDGTCGFAIDPDGNLVSVFNLNVTRGFLRAAKDFIIEQGATHLDAYASNQQNLREMYEKLLGAKVASSMDYNMDFDHDDIAKNHGNPQVVFMVLGKAAEGDVVEKHFDKESYDDAVNYQQTVVAETNPKFQEFKRAVDSLAGYFEGGGRYLSNDYPNIPDELVSKLGAYFMIDTPLSIDGYRELYKYLRVEVRKEGDKTIYVALPKEASKPTTPPAPRIQKHQGDWTRNEAQNNPRILYVFTDNVDRDSGSGVIPTDSWYSRKYGEGHHYPTSTAAVIRGLDNARPISTMHYFYKTHGFKHPLYYRDSQALWHDSDVNEFRQVIRGELQDIADEFATGKYDSIMFPDGDGLFNTKLSNITKERTPILYQALVDLLQEYGFYSLIPADADTSTTAPSTASQTPSSAAMGSRDLGLTEADRRASEARMAQRQALENAPEFERPKGAAYDSALNVTIDRITQFRRTFSPQQIKDRGAYIARIFSDIIDDLVEQQIADCQKTINEENAKEEKDRDEQKKRDAEIKLRDLQDPIEGRQKAAQDAEGGMQGILQKVRARLQDSADHAKEEKKVLYDNTLEYFEELFNTQASLDIEEKEGIRIVGLQISDKTAAEDENDETNDGNDETGHFASGSDGWSFQVRYENPFNSLSKMVRRMLYEIERPEGEVDDLGVPRYYSMGQIYASLLSYLAKNMTSPDDFLQVYHSFDEIPENSAMNYADEDDFNETYPNGYPVFPVLERMKGMYPWVEQVIQRLTDDYLSPELNDSLRFPATGGAMASQLYTNFKKAYIPYAKIQVGGNKNGIIPLNYQMEDRVQYDKLAANYNNRLILNDKCIYTADGKLNRINAAILADDVSSIIYSFEHHSYQDYPELIAQDEQAEREEDKILSQADRDEYDKFIDDVRNLLNSFGIDATRDTVAIYLTVENGEKLGQMLKNLSEIANILKDVEDDKVDSFNYLVDTQNSYKRNLLAHLFDGIGMITDGSYMQSFYDSASHKTKYSYSADNYLMQTFRGVTMGTLEERREYIDEHFGKYEWFRDQQTGEWKNAWLEYWYNETGKQTELPYRNIDNVTEKQTDALGNTTGTTVRQYTKWEPRDIWGVQNLNYDREIPSRTAFYLAPIFSDSPMSMTVKGPRMGMGALLYGYIDTETNTYHKGALVKMVDQELERIAYVQRRAEAIKKGEVKPIANFDEGRGLKFCFMPELNDYICEATDKYPAEKFLDRLVRMKNEKATAAEINDTKIRAIKDCIDAKMRDYEAELLQNGILNGKEYLDEEEYYNMTYANAAIIQLTTVDLAYYKDETDFQKRFKEVYAGGTQLNTNSKYGYKYENVILLSDDIITSPSYNEIAAVIDGAEHLSDAEKERIKGVFTDINVADAQAIRAMHAFRGVLDMMGKWNSRMEEAMQRFKDGTWTAEDFEVTYQTIKPFMYSVIDRNDGFGGVIPVPQQHKNSEICALMMYSLISNDLRNSPVYEALSEFMEETVDAAGNHLIHMAQFESAGKVGNQGVINISFNPTKIVSIINDGYTTKSGKTIEISAAYIEKDNGEIEYVPNTDELAITNYYNSKKDKYKGKTAKNGIKEQLDRMLKNGELTQEEYREVIDYLRPTKDEIKSMLAKHALITNPDGSKAINTEVVHTTPMNNYYETQPTPQHHVDAEATFGSQARNLTVADLPGDFELELEIKGGKTITLKGRDAVIDFYYELLDENLLEDFFGVDGKGGLKAVFSSKDNLRQAVEEIVRGNPKYGSDFADALTIVDGKFALNPNSPTVFNMMQEIITSLFKNRITKQKINGAALIQAAGIGLDENLRVVFDEKTGKLIGAQCYLPLTSKKFFEPLIETRTINGKKVQYIDPKKLEKAGLDKAVGYRIPTENKSSMMPLIIAGFTPQQNGSAIILPAEITAMAGSDFDVDKMFLMLSSFYVQNYRMRQAREDYAKSNALFRSILQGLVKGGNLNEDDLNEDEIKELDDEAFKAWFEENKEQYRLKEPRIRKIEYDWDKTPEQNGRRARNNMLIQMMYKILVSKPGSESLFNPQGFPDVEKAAKIIRIVSDDKLVKKLSQNLETGVMPPAAEIRPTLLALVQEKYPQRYDEFKDAINRVPDEQLPELYAKAAGAGNKADIVRTLMEDSTKNLADFIKDNSSPESPIYPQAFMHAHARNMAGTNQIGIYAIQASMAAKYQRASVILNKKQIFKLNGRDVDRAFISENGKRVKNNGQMVGASADNGKNPNLTDMGSTNKTAAIIGYMHNLGLSPLEAAAIINQPCMKMCGFSTRGRAAFNIFGKNPLEKLKMGNVTTEMLLRSIISPLEITDEEEMAIRAVCYRILQQYEGMEYITQVSRADSPNGAMQNTYAKARIQQYKVDLLQAKMDNNFPFVRIQEALSNDAIDTAASKEVVREQLKSQKMAFLHGMYALGINSFTTLMEPYFFGAKKWFDEKITKQILYNLPERRSDDEKEDIVNHIYVSYITYMLSGSPLFGDDEAETYKEKREKYIVSYPNKFIDILRENKEVRDLLGNILQVINAGDRKKIVLKDVGSLSKEVKHDIQIRFEKLLYSDNPVVQEVAKDLFMYSYYDNGLNFSHNTFGHLFTTKFLISMTAYTRALDALDEEITDEQAKNFISQFLATYPEAAMSVDAIVDSKVNVTNNGDTLEFNFNDPNQQKAKKALENDVMSPNRKSKGIKLYPYIKYNNDVYMLDEDAYETNKGLPKYNKIPTYATFPHFPLFNMNMSLTELADEFPRFPAEAENKQGKAAEAPSNTQETGAPMENNDSNEDPAFEQDIYSQSANAVDTMDDSDFDEDEYFGDDNQNNYQSEGEAKLQKPLCKKII